MASVKKEHKLATKVAMRNAIDAGAELPTLPLVVSITRIGPRRLDGDNLQSACKYVRDQIATIVGIDDGSDQYTWRYEQRMGDYGIEVEITSR